MELLFDADNLYPTFSMRMLFSEYTGIRALRFQH
jgi:hypothetical protein